MQLLAGIETGGTKILARLCNRDDGSLFAEHRWETSSAAKAADNLAEFLSDVPAGSELVAVGMAAFGPLIVNPTSPDYGQMLSTTKPGWTGSNLRAELQSRLSVPVMVDSDVNVAAVAEQALGAGQGLSSVAYVTVGTGIGAGLAIDGKGLKGAIHPEGGHLPVVRRPDDREPSVCRFHTSCAEGLASGPAVRRRLGGGRELADDPALMEVLADYLGQLAMSLVLAWSPCRIVWGGGVIGAAPLIPLIEARLRELLSGYGVGPAVERPDFCVPAALTNAGLEGAMIMARQLAEQG
jgi:fructokinase